MTRIVAFTPELERTTSLAVSKNNNIITTNLFVSYVLSNARRLA